ncbi:MAG: triphosphoribosyl-dephospho-CoA synthase MdcB [Pseudomonadota bacterium]
MLAAHLVQAAFLQPDTGVPKEAARLALRALYAELRLYPKPGLVSLVDNGSHDDMEAATFMRSLFSLRHYFAAICQAGIDDAPFALLRQLGIDAERRMLAATRGINTHRGAIFSLGLLCAAFGRARAQGIKLTPAALRAVLLIRWGEELGTHMQHGDTASHGAQAAARYAVSGAREEGALGLPSVFNIGLPALHAALARGARLHEARTDALFALMAHASDTNVFHRGGADGARLVRSHAQRFIDNGGTASADWRAQALACHRLFVARRLSPGGAADLLAATCLVHAFVAANWQ